LSKYRNISGGELALGWPGAMQATAADGEVVDIPDFQPDGESPIVVPGDKWEPVAESKVAPEKASKSKAAV
jgi:hypothetical protein